MSKGNTCELLSLGMVLLANNCLSRLIWETNSFWGLGFILSSIFPFSLYFGELDVLKKPWERNSSLEMVPLLHNMSNKELDRESGNWASRHFLGILVTCGPCLWISPPLLWYHSPILEVSWNSLYSKKIFTCQRSGHFFVIDFFVEIMIRIF